MARVLHQPDWNRTFRPIVNRANLYADESQQDYQDRYGPGRSGLGPGGRPFQPLRDFLRSLGTVGRNIFGLPQRNFGMNQSGQQNIGLEPGYHDILGQQATGPRTFSTGMTPVPRNGYVTPQKYMDMELGAAPRKAGVSPQQLQSNAAILRQRQRQQWQEQRPQRQQTQSNAAILRRRARQHLRNYLT